MKMLDQKRDELGKLLACLLVTRKGACSIRELEKDYYATEGRVIPFREFGFHSTLDFLRSIPNYIRLTRLNDEYLVRPVVSDKIKHVNEMVNRQRHPKKSALGRRKLSRYSRYYPTVPEPKHFIPNNVQKKMAYMLSKNPSGVEPSSIAECLQNSNAIARPVDATNVKDYINGVPHIAVASGSYVYPSRSLAATIEAEQCKIQTTNSYTPATRDLSKYSDVFPNIACPGGSEEGAEFYDDEDFYENCLDDDCPLEPSVGANYPSVNDDYQLEKLSRTQNDKRLKLSVAEFIAPDNRRQEFELPSCASENGNKGAEVDDVRDDEDNYEREYIYSSEDEVVDVINPRMQSRLQQLIKKHPDGIWCADLLQTFLDEYKVQLDYVELGFASVCELAANLGKIFHLQRWDDRGDFMLYDATQPIPKLLKKTESHSQSPVWENELSDNDDMEPFPLNMALQVTEKLIPSNVMTHRESVGQERIPELTDEEDCIEVYVADVYTPSLFWVHLRKKRLKLYQLMESMHEFYQQEGDKYTIPHVILEKGLNCVCLFENKWHRAIIKTVKPDGDVTLIFYDFGTTKSYPPDSVRYLHRKFSNLPAQSITAGLYNLKPVNSDVWSQGVSLEFWTKVMDLPLMAIVIKVDTESNSMLVSLVDTQYEEDIHINDWMVYKKLAEYGGMVRRRPSNFVFKHYLACTNYHYDKHMENVKAVKINRQTNSRVARPESQNSSSSKEKLKSADYLKNLMFKYSKYKKESNCSVSAGTKITVRQADMPRQYINTSVSDCSSKNLSALDTVGPISDTLIVNRFSKICKLTRSLSSKEKIHTLPKQPQFSDTCEQTKNKEIGNKGEDSSSSFKCVEKSTETLNREKQNNNSKITNEDFIEGEVSSGRLEYSGTFRSFFGGHGHMNPIDWSKLREDITVEREQVSSNAKAKSRAIDECPLFNLSQENTNKTEPPRYTQGCSNEPSKESSYWRKFPDMLEVIDSSVGEPVTRKILPAKDCFLNAVKCNKDNYYSAHGKKLWWSPEGNIQNRQGAITPLLKVRRKNIKESELGSMKVYASPEIVTVLRGENLQNKVPDPELDFLITLKKQNDRYNTEIVNELQNISIKNKLSSNVSKSSQSVTTSSPNTRVENEKPDCLSKTRFSTILNYMNKKKQTDVTSISMQNSSSVQHSSTSIDTESVEAPDTTSSNLNQSDSSLNSSEIMNSQKEEDALRERGLNSIKIPEQVSNSIKTGSSLDARNKSSSVNSSSSENIDVVVESNKLSEHQSSTVVPEINKMSEKRHTTPENEQYRVSLLNVTPLKCTPREVIFNNETVYTEAGTQFSDLPDLSDNESSKKQKKIATSPYSSPRMLQSKISNLQSDNVSDSELDSDDLSHSCSASEAEIMQLAPRKSIVYSTDNIQLKTSHVAEASVVPQDSSSDERESSRENSSSSNESVPSVNNEQIESCASKIVPEKFVPQFNDLESISDSDDWDVNGEWIDFIKGQFVDKSEIGNNESKLAICDRNNDKSELDDVSSKIDFNAGQINEFYHDKFPEICDTINSSNSELYDSGRLNDADVELESKIESTNCMELPDNCSRSSSESSRKNSGVSSATYVVMHSQNEKVTDKTSLVDIAADLNLIPSNKKICSNVSTIGFESEKNTISNNEINNLVNDTKVSIENQSHGEIVTISSERSSDKNSPSLTSKTKSMHDMLQNLKLKSNLKLENNHIEEADSNLKNTANVFTSAELHLHLKSEETYSTSSEKSQDSSAKKLFFESEMFADSSSTSNSSRPSLNVVSSDMIESARHSEIVRYMTAHKNDPYLKNQHSTPLNSPKTSSDENEIEFVEEQLKPPSKQLSMSILSRIKMEQLSTKSPSTNVNIISERDNVLLNKSSLSSQDSSTPLLDRIKHIYSKHN